MFVFRAKRGGHRLFDKRRKSDFPHMNDVRIVLTFSDITKSKASLRSLSAAFYGCKGNTFSRHRQIFMQKSLLFPSPLRGHPLFSRASPAWSQPSNLPCPKEGFEPLSKPPANRWRKDVIDSENWFSPSRFWYGSPAFVPSGFAMVFNGPDGAHHNNLIHVKTPRGMGASSPPLKKHARPLMV